LVHWPAASRPLTLQKAKGDSDSTAAALPFNTLVLVVFSHCPQILKICFMSGKLHAQTTVERKLAFETSESFQV
jgi:hypothetical protein